MSTLTENPRAVIGGNNPPPLATVLKERHKEQFDKAKKLLPRLKKADLKPVTREDCAKLDDLFGEARDLANDADRIRETEKEPYLSAGREIDALFHGEFRDALGTDPKKGGLARQILQAAADRKLAITREEQRQAEAAALKAREEANRLEAQARKQEEAGRTKIADVTHAKVDAVDRQADALAAQAAAPVSEASRGRTVGGRSSSVDAKLECTGVVRAELDLESLRPYFKQQDLIDAVNVALKMKAFDTLKGAAIVEKAVGRVR